MRVPPALRLLAPGLLAAGLALAGGGGPAVSGVQELPAPPAAGRTLFTALAAGREGPVLAWTQRRPGSNFELHAARLTGGGWTPLGGKLNEGPEFNAGQLTARTDPRGRVWLGWSEDAGLAHVDSYLMSVWDGQAWSDPGRYAVRRNLSDAGRSRSFALEPNGTPTLAWIDIGVPGAWAGAVRPLVWRGGTWTPQPVLNDLSRAGFGPDLAVSAAGRRTVALLEGDFATMNVWVQREEPGGAWTSLGGALNRRSGSFAATPRLVLAADGLPVVAWIEEDETGHDRLNVSRWRGGGWEALAQHLSTVGVSAEAPALALTPTGRPVAAWLEAGHLRGARWEGGRWVPLPLPATREATGPSLSADGAYLAASDGGRLRVWRVR